ncbi:MAG: substrate-binding domain-containing protein [Burkholderiales bacterium]|nr:substrate-binding domain-containing protein [Burkholderiales bacterium]
MRIEVFSGNGMRAALAQLAPQFERASGDTLQVSYDPGQIILRRVEAGETADAVVVGEETIDRLIARGFVAAASRRVLTRNGIGLAVRAAAPKPDIATEAGFVQALRAARSIAYTSEGASGIYFAALIERLGLADMVRAKARTQPGGLIGELILTGEAEIAIQQLPELLAVPGIDVVGPLPDTVQKIATTAAGVFAGSSAATQAADLIEFLASPRARAVFRACGFDSAS